MPTILSTLESMRQNMAAAAAAATGTGTAAHPDDPPHNHTQSTTTTGLQASTTLDLTATATALSPLPLDDADSPNPEHLVLPLGPLDQVQVRKYTPRIFCFPMADQQLPTVSFATASLRLAVQKVLCRWPFLAGRLRYVDGGNKNNDKNGNNTVEVRYDYPPPDAVQARVFHAQVLPDFEMEYGKLSAAGMPPSMLDCVALCGREEDGLGLDEGDDGFPVWRVQANFVPGGLLLAVADAHPVVDGVAAGLVVEELARCLRVGEVAAECEVGERVGAATVDGQRNGGDDDHHHQQQRETTSSTPCTIPEFELPDPQLIPTTAGAAGGKPTARILTIRASTLATLKTAVMAEVRRTSQPPAAFVSTQDVLSALLWTAIIRARAPRLLLLDDDQHNQQPTTHFCTAVDARNKPSSTSHPPLVPPTYLGNAVMYAIAAEPISTTASTTTTTTITTTHLATAALAIRASIAAVAVPPFITRRIAAWSPPALPDPTHLLAVLGAKLDLPHSGVFVTSWVGFGGDVGWCVPGVGGGVKAEWIRKPWGVGEGTAVVLPRRGGAKGDNGVDWDVLVRLGEGDMEAFLGLVGELDGALGMGLVERVVE